MTSSEVFALVILPGLIVLGAFGSLAWHRRYLSKLTAVSPSTGSTYRQRDQDLILAFARFESTFIRKRRDYTVEQLQLIQTPLGFSPK